MKEDNKLPEKQSKGLKAKIRRAMLILLSSVGIITQVNSDSNREEPKITKMESNIDEGKKQRENFKESLKTVTSNESIINGIIENRR